MTIYLRQSTAGQEIPLGHFLDSTDGDTEETSLTIANTDIKIWKFGATTLANKNSGGATHISNGIYYAVLDATDTNTLGSLVVFVHVAGALAVKVECVVLAANVYDSMIAGSDLLDVNASQLGGTSQTAGAVIGSGTHYPQTGDSYAYLTANLGPSGTNATEVGGNGDHLTNIPWNATWDSEVQSECADALSDFAWSSVAIGSISGVIFPTNFNSLSINPSGVVDSFVQGFLNNSITEGSAGRIANNFTTFYNNNNITSTVLISDIGSSSGTTDWTATERNQIRTRLGIDGTKATPSSSNPSLGSVSMTSLSVYNPSGNGVSITSSSGSAAAVSIDNDNGGPALSFTSDGANPTLRMYNSGSGKVIDIAALGTNYAITITGSNGCVLYQTTAGTNSAIHIDSASTTQPAFQILGATSSALVFYENTGMGDGLQVHSDNAYSVRFSANAASGSIVSQNYNTNDFIHMESNGADYVTYKLIQLGLDHLVTSPASGLDIANNSIIAQLASTSSDWDTYDNTTDSLQAIRDKINSENGSSFTNIPWNSAWDSPSTGVLHLYNVPTRSELILDKEEIIQSGIKALDVWSYGHRTLTNLGFAFSGDNFAADSLNNKGNWNTVTPPTVSEIRVELDNNSSRLHVISGDLYAATQHLIDIKGVGWTSDNSLIAIRNRGDTAWTTASGFLQSSENGSSFTAIPWNPAWDVKVQSGCFDALNVYKPMTGIMPINFDKLLINSNGHISRVTLVDSNSDMRGTDNALLAANAPVNFSNLSITDNGRVSISGNLHSLDQLNNIAAADVWSVGTRELSGLGFVLTDNDFAAGSLNDKGNWNVGKSGYYLDSQGLANVIPADPSAIPTLGVTNIVGWIGFFGAQTVNEWQVTSSAAKLRNSADSADLASYAHSDDGTTFTSGPPT